MKNTFWMTAQETENELKSREIKSRDDLAEQRAKAIRAKRNAARRERNQLMRDCGLVRGKDSMGRTIWE